MAYFAFLNFVPSLYEVLDDVKDHGTRQRHVDLLGRQERDGITDN